MSVTNPQPSSEQLSNVNTRDADTYVEAAMRTKSDIYRPDLVDMHRFLDTLTTVVATGKAMRGFKRSAFGGKEPETPVGTALTGREFGNMPPDVLHAIMGVLNEAGEIAEALLACIASGTFDPKLFDEEFGDKQWFTALYCKGRGITLSELMRRNICKLVARYPHKFDASKLDDAGRDKEAEYRAMYGGNPARVPGSES